MELTKKIHSKLEKILTRLKVLEVIDSFKLEINFCQVEENFKSTLYDIDSILKKCLKKILTKPRKAEIRNVITELVRKKNLTRSPFSAENQRNYGNEIKSAGIPDLVFYCNDCQMNFEDREDWIIHKKQHKKKKTYLCEKCGLLFNSFFWWMNHSQDHLLSNTSPNLDDQSHIVNSSSKEFSEEAKTNYKKDFESIDNLKPFDHSPLPLTESKFICKCKKEFRLLKTLKKHESLKHSTKTVTFSCSVCKRLFKEKGKMNRHMLSHSKSQYKCCYCLKDFTRSDSLKRHLSLTHQPQEYFSCSFCQKKFNLKYNRDVHEENIHKKINNWIQCDQCGKKFKNKLTFKIHLQIHSEKRFVCKLCSKSFTRKIQLSNHFKNSHNQSFSEKISKEKKV